ncbi:MAG TPA: phosphatase PAP2 family protein [Longimicrobiales bacterium]
MRRRRAWVARDVLAAVVARFRNGAAALPDRAWRQWRIALAAGCGAVLLLAIGLVHAGRFLATDGALTWEADFLRRLEASLPLSFSTAVWLQSLGTDITLAIVVLFTASIAAWSERPFHALSIAFALVGLDLIVRIAWLLWDRPRPDLILDGAAAPGFASFPSGHAAKSVAVYGMLAFLWGRSSTSTAERALAAALATTTVLLVVIGRLRMGVHWPSDIVAGALLGIAWLTALALALSRAERAATTNNTGAAEPAAP